MQKKFNELLIIDLGNLVFRAFYAMPSLSAPDGTPVNAVYGVFNMLLKLIRDYPGANFLVAMDNKDGSFRNEIGEKYKANRTAPPDDLLPQFALIEEMISLMKMASLRIPRYEADDLMGTAAVQWVNFFEKIILVTGDKDIMQFVTGNVVQLDPMKGKIYQRTDVYEKFGVFPEQIVDYLALVGDSSDNIPGVRGIGAKGAVKLLSDFKTLDNLLERVGEITNLKVRRALMEMPEMAKLSQKLAKITVDLNLGLAPHDTVFNLSFVTELEEFFGRINFQMAAKKLREVIASPFSENKIKKEASIVIENCSVETFLDDLIQEVLIMRETLQDFLIRLALAKEVAIAMTTLGEDTDTREITRFSFAFSADDHQVFHIEMLDIFPVLKEIVSNSQMVIVTYQLREFISFLLKNALDIPLKIVDLEQAHHLLAPEQKHSFENILIASGQHLQLSAPFENIRHKMPPFYLVCWKKLFADLKVQKLDGVYFDLDMAVAPILVKMEWLGILLNDKYLKVLETEYQQELQSIQEKIHEITQAEVNLRSPKQVGQLLYEKLGHPVLKKGKTAPSTNVKVLEELASLKNNDGVPELILKFRELDKLLSTYIKVLPKLMDPLTHRIHTRFHQAVTATGRLSSDRPNLQNIPTRTIYGRKIRHAFNAEEGTRFLAFDYSQIELRLLAHFSQDPVMKTAFINGEDIHGQTAAEIHSVSLDQVTSEQRSMAKSVNFGLMYGQSSFGLADSLHIPQHVAKDYIVAYFKNFSQVRLYLDELKERCVRLGYAETLFGRKRFLPDINSRNRTLRQSAERMAINTPIQGTAADLLKKAMIEISQEFAVRKINAAMVLQIHDELLFQVPHDEVTVVSTLVKKMMQEVVILSVPLEINVSEGRTWGDVSH